MATRTSVKSGLWSAPGTWNTGVPLNNDTVVIAAGHSVCFDVDQSAFANGIAGLTIQGGATPGMLYAKHDAAGTYYLKLKTGTNIVGTLDTNRGRLVATVDGTFASTSALPYDRKFIIELAGTAQLEATYLDVNMRCDEPTNTYVETYGTAYGPVVQTTAVNTTTGVIDWGTAPPAAGTAVRVKSSGTLPTGLLSECTYYVRGVSGNTCKLAGQNADINIVIPSATGSGNITMYTGYAAGSATVNVLQNVTADKWAVGDSVVLCDVAPENYDIQRLTLNEINAGTLVLSAAVDSVQFPLALVVLSSRNVSIRAGRTPNTAIVLYGANDTHGGRFGEIRNTNAAALSGYGVQNGANVFATTISGCSYGIRYGSGCTATTISGCSDGINYGSGHTATTISGCIYGIRYGSGHTVTTISGCSDGIYAGSGHTVTTISGCSNGINYGSGCTVTTISGCSYGIYLGSGCTATTISGCNYGIYQGSGNTATTISGCNYGIYQGSGHTATTISGCSDGINSGSGYTATTISGCIYGIHYGGINARGCTLENNSYDIRYPANSVLFASALLSSTQVGDYLGQGYSSFVWSYDHGGSVGRIKSWTGGGTIASQEWTAVDAGVKTGCPIMPDYLHLATFELASHFNFFEWPLVSDGRTTISVTVYARKQQAGETDFPRFAICDMTKNFPDATAELDAEDMADNTDWQTITLSYTPTDTQQLCLRFQGKNASGTCYFLPVITQMPTPAEIAAAMWADETSPQRTTT